VAEKDRSYIIYYTALHHSTFMYGIAAYLIVVAVTFAVIGLAAL
jgi:hypothetical protein